MDKKFSKDQKNEGRRINKKIINEDFGFRVLGLRVLRFRVLGFRVLGFRV